MPAISKAVNSFSSESVQQDAFAAILRSLAGEQSGRDMPEQNQGAPQKATRPKRPASGSPTKAGSGERPRKRASAPSFVRDLNLRPPKKRSFDEFVALKQPQNDRERLVVATFWLQHEAEISELTPSHLYTCFKQAKWKVPNNLKNALQVVASKKGWIDTANSADLRVTIAGENFVEHDLPKQSAASHPGK